MGDTVTASVCIVIPSIPGRAGMLGEAVSSVACQTHPCQVVVQIDHEREGAWATRNKGIWRALAQGSEWIGFLDDDDYLLPHHVEHLLDQAAAHDADVVWPWFVVEGGTDPFPMHRGRQYDPANPHIFPITYLARIEAVANAMYEGGFREDPGGTGNWGIQDQPFITSMWRHTGGRFWASDEATWVWRHHARNTSGVPTR